VSDKIQRPSAELRFAEELATLRSEDAGPRPPGWQLTLPAARTFVMGDASRGISAKYVGNPSLVERSLVTLATTRGLMLVGEPGTAKSLLSELLAAAITGDSTLTIQGGAATTEDQIRYSWNYALLVAEGPSKRSLVPAPIYRAMAGGAIVRFEEITRCPLEVQDTLLSLLSERVLAVPELTGDDAMVFAREGFNIIATANTRDRGVNEMSAALKRRFNFETVHPISDLETEIALVRGESDALLAASGVPVAQDPDIVDLLVTLFRDLRTGYTSEGASVDRVSAVMSTAEAVSVAHATGIRGWFLRGQAGGVTDLVESLAGVAAKDSAEDLARLRRYINNDRIRRPHPRWSELRAASSLLPGP
jgi:MoxR-like ATPase